MQFTKNKVCQVCGKEFLPNSGRQVHCAKKCERVTRSKYRLKYAELNKEKLSKQHADYFQRNKQRYNLRQQERYRNDQNFYMSQVARSSVKQCLNLFGFKKKSKTIEYIGCDTNTLKCHLERQFCDVVNWDSKGKWHIDHIIPIKYFQKHNLDIKSSTHYTNLQPLLSALNYRKNNRIHRKYLPKIIAHPETPDELLNVAICLMMY